MRDEEKVDYEHNTSTLWVLVQLDMVMNKEIKKTVGNEYIQGFHTNF